jgi:uncharacterized YigZ family protein
MDVLIRNISAERVVKNSKFLAELLVCSSQQKARLLIRSQKGKYTDATHVVHAFITGPSGEISGMSDDGEPSGTAGRPVLDVLKGRACTNTLLTITRWFGGTLLGTGGLVKAYSESAKAVIAEADNIGAFEEFVEKRSFSFTVDYALCEKIKHKLLPFHLYDIKEYFSDNVLFTGSIRADECTDFESCIQNISNGMIEGRKIWQ